MANGTEQTINYVGTLVGAPESRYAPIDGEGHMAPALCLKVLLDNPPNVFMQLEQIFPAGADRQCLMAARRLRAGMRVTVTAPLFGLRLTARFVEHIHVHKQTISTIEPEAQACPL